MLPVIRAALLVAFATLSSVNAAEPKATISSANIPLARGLMLTTALAEPSAVYESRKYLLAREAEGWLLSYSTSLPTPGGRPRIVATTRFLHDADLASARIYRNQFEDGVDEDYPGTTALGASKLILAELKSKGTASFAMVGDSQWLSRASKTDPSQAALLQLTGGLMSNQNTSFKGELKLRTTGSLSVLVNGQPQALPIVIASGRFAAKNGSMMQVELSLLDDPGNPLSLQWRIGSSALRVVRLDFPVVMPASKSLSQTLREQKRVTLPGLYFDFGSAVLKPESNAALKAALVAVRANAGAKMRLEGHTDSIGKPDANISLSRARAIAVYTALLKLDPSLAFQLQTEGYGATRPKADNGTLEGRAQNRRVELVLL